MSANSSRRSGVGRWNCAVLICTTHIVSSCKTSKNVLIGTFFDKNIPISNFFRKKSAKYLVVSKKLRTFAPANQKSTAAFSASRNRRGAKEGSVAQLNRASDYGSEGCGFESRRNHKKSKVIDQKSVTFLFYSKKIRL